MPKAELNHENLDALEKGLPNLLHHVENIIRNVLPPALRGGRQPPSPPTRRPSCALVEDKCRELGVSAALSEVWAKGGEGGKALAAEVVRLCEEPCPEQPTPEEFTFAYRAGQHHLSDKLNAIVNRRSTTATQCRPDPRRPEAGQAAH